MMGILLIPLIAAVAVCQSQAADLVEFGSADDFSGFLLSCARWDPSAGGVVFDASASPRSSEEPAVGLIESPEIGISGRFDEAIVSWNARTRAGAYLIVYARSRVGKSWSRWYNMGLWSAEGCSRRRTSLKGQDDDFGRVDTDTLVLKKPAEALQLRVELRSADGADYPVLRFLSVNAVRSSAGPKPDTPGGRSLGAPTSRGGSPRAWGTELDVPQLCQLSVDGGRPWCSPTCTAMALGYWAKKLKRPDLEVGIREVAAAVYDEAWGGTGNWVFNAAYAGEFEGMRAYVTRFDSVSKIEQWVAKGVPVIVSVDYNKLNRRATENSMGHLVLVRGFTRAGSPIANDPWAHLDKGEKVRKIFPRADLERSWLGPTGSRGTVYLIYPENWKER